MLMRLIVLVTMNVTIFIHRNLAWLQSSSAFSAHGYIQSKHIQRARRAHNMPRGAQNPPAKTTVVKPTTVANWRLIWNIDHRWPQKISTSLWSTLMYWKDPPCYWENSLVPKFLWPCHHAVLLGKVTLYHSYAIFSGKTQNESPCSIAKTVAMSPFLKEQFTINHHFP